MPAILRGESLPVEPPWQGKVWAERTQSHGRKPYAPELTLGMFPTKLKAPLDASQQGSPGANNLAH